MFHLHSDIKKPRGFHSENPSAMSVSYTHLSGDEISIKSDLENRDDTWLAIFPEGIPQLSGALTPVSYTHLAIS